jgi:hypothetical protein
MPEVEKPDLGHRRAAIQIVAQLPETQADALLILEAARDFVLKFLSEDHLEEAGRPPPGFVDLARECVVLTLVSGQLSFSRPEPLTHIDGQEAVIPKPGRSKPTEAATTS